MHLHLFGSIRAVLPKNSVAYFSRMASRKGLILGVFTPENENCNSDSNASKDAPVTADQFTSSAARFNQETSGVLLKQLNCSEPIKCGKLRLLYGLSENYGAVAVAGLGKKSADIDESEQWHTGRENVRSATALGARALRDVGVKSIDVDPCGYPDAAAEGAVLSLFTYDELKSKADAKKPEVELNLYNAGQEAEGTSAEKWRKGVLYAEGQNLARKLMEMPANLLPPTRFAEIAQELASKTENFEVIPHDKQWAEEKKMYSFLSVNQGAYQPPVFLEMRVKSKKQTNGERPTVVLVGKGVCFDSGGISLKPSANMDKMRADMGGAANVLAALYTLSRLEADLPFDLVGLTPMVENMPGGKATKPGDIVCAMNGKSIKIDNTDAEGRLILADALCYADTFKPRHVIDIATLTGAMLVSLGTVATGTFCSDDRLWEAILAASKETGDRVWRLPLFKAYNAKMKADCADLNNIAKPNAGAGSCVAAGFLREFTECKSWAHLDIAGVMEADGDLAYLPKGMTGRPLRLLVNMLENLGS